MVTKTELDKIQALVDAAVPGPWEVRWLHYVVVGPDKASVWGDEALTGLWTEEEWMQVEKNVAFIAASRDGVVKLLAEVRRLQSLVECGEE